MEKFLEVSGNILAVLGVSICLIAGIARMLGNYHLLGYEAVTLFIAGIALMVMGCLAKLQRMSMDQG